MTSPKKILVCVLDWGLGHATRCIPVIREFASRGCDVVLASSGSALKLLQIEFPTLDHIQLPAYNPEYSKTDSLVGQMIRQLPKFRKVIEAEHKIVEEFVDQNGVDIVISDNRYGCWSSTAESIFITHQLKVLTPSPFAWAAPGINWVLGRQIKKFNQVWIPDRRGSGLTEVFFSKIVKQQRFIGWLSRFMGSDRPEIRYAIMAIISGPEPQRSIFYDKVKKQLSQLNVKSLIVSGEPGEPYLREVGNLTTVNHLNAQDMERAISQSELLVGRSGYSTIMDLIALGKNAIFVPTPGQPEQEHFAEILRNKGMIFSQSQEEFELKKAMEQSTSYSGLGVLKMNTDALREAVTSLLV